MAGRALLARERIDDSLTHHRRALRTAAEHGMPYPIAEALEAMAEATTAAGEHHRAAGLLGTAASVRSQMGAPKLAAHRQRDLDALTASLRERLGEARFTGAFAEGGRRAPSDVVTAIQST